MGQAIAFLFQTLSLESVLCDPPHKSDTTSKSEHSQ